MCNMTKFGWLSCFQCVAVVVFLSLGIFHTSPYWLFDGFTFVIFLIYLTSIMARFVPFQSCVKFIFASVAFIQFCVSIIAIVLFNNTMNPFKDDGFASAGQHYVLCSLISCALNLFGATCFHVHDTQSDVTFFKTI